MPIIIGNMKALNMKYDELWFVMHSMKWYFRDKKTGEINKNAELISQPNVHVVNDLAPSHELYTFYLSHKNRGTWDEDVFWTKYVPMFIHEMSTQEDSRDKLNELYCLDKQGKTILLVCACQEENICHRSILAGLLYGVGCDVKSSFGTDISKYKIYYEMYTIERNKCI